MLNAFNGNAATRVEALDRLHARMRAKTLTSGAFFMSVDKASVAAALVESNVPDVWEAQLGLAKWVAYALDYTTAKFGVDAATELAEGLLGSIPVGYDTSTVGSKVIAKVLDEVAAMLDEEGEVGVPLLAACDEIRALHQRVRTGEALTPAVWRSARKTATAAVNAIDESQIKAKALGGVVEAGAWDPVVAPTTVGDVLRVWIQAQSCDADQQFGWTAEDETRTRGLLTEMHKTYKEDRPEEERDVFMLLRVHHPEVEARLLAYTKFKGDCGQQAAMRTGKLLLDVTKSLQ